MRQIDKIIIHCSATPEGRDVKTEEIRRWHIEERGWSDIGYHYVVELDGSVNMGRHTDSIGAHTRGENTGSIGICYVGGMDANMELAKDTRTEAQKKGLRCLISDLKKKYGTLTIHGHNEYSTKECPSFNVDTESY
jgi:N-acetylmuramoyl-L-alanine amidase